MTRSSLSHTPFLITFLVVLLPVLTLTVGGGSALFYLLIVACLCMVATTPATHWMQQLRPYRWLLLVLCLPLAAVLLSQLLNAHWEGPSIERGLRISLGFPCLLAGFLLIDRQRLRHFIWGPITAGIAATAIVCYLAGPTLQRPPTPQFNAVGYGNLMLLMAVLSIYSLSWQCTRHPRAERAFKIAAAALTCVGFVLTQTRTGWMAIPVFAIIGIALAGWLHRPMRALAALLGIGLIALAVGASNPALRERVTQGAQEIHECLTVAPTADTSMCIRLQLWNSAWHMFKSAPWSGTGDRSSFKDMLQQGVAAGRVSPFVARDFGEPHNDFLQALATLGVAGGIALLALYFAPAWLFLRRLRRNVPQTQRVAAAMGLAVCLSFAIFGLTELMFRGMRTVSLYVAFIALFTALSAPSPDQADDLAPK
ncbi:O-antigen ligase family protein [Bordetella tumulicola]|uniref:O-antigen ligase family protein n=1 Tax=Bordetella tumulicola TaxID=1649133 RepID=UPI0039F04B42